METFLKSGDCLKYEGSKNYFGKLRHFQKRLHLGPFLKDGTSLEAEDIFIIQAH